MALSTSKDDDFGQAVIVMDEFDGLGKFGTPTFGAKPLALIPVVNCPLLEYVLELLNTSLAVHEVLLYCMKNADEIRDYIRHSRWSSGSDSKMKIKTVASESCCSLGDALRDIYDKRLIRGDFILISGNVISNADLMVILQKHKERRKMEKNALMTMVYKRAALGRGAFQAEPRSIVVTDDATNRLYHHQIVPYLQKKITVPLSVFQGKSVMSVSHDLLDCHISICSLEVLSLFSDNFDYQTRNDFVKGILENEEILGNTIYVHLLDDEYAASITNVSSYEAVSSDIMNRWVFPFVPDLMKYKKQKYIHLKYNVYRHKDVKVARSSRLRGSVIVGSGAKIGNNTVISDSVIGHNCTIGDNVQLKHAFLWDDVTVEDDCTVNTAILADKVTLKSKSRIMNSVIYCNFKVAAGSVIENEILASKTKEEYDDDEFEDNYGDENDDFDNENDRGDLFRSSNVHMLAYETSETGSMSEQDFGENDCVNLMDDTKVFFGEVFDTLVRGIEEKLKCDNLVLEINGLKYAYNVTMSEVNFLVTKALLEIHKEDANRQSGGVTTFSRLKEIFVQFHQLLKNYIRNENSQYDFLNSVKEFASANDYFVPMFVKALHFLYESELLQEEYLVTWFQKLDVSDVKDKLIKEKMEPFITWLMEAEEESD